MEVNHRSNPLNKAAKIIAAVSFAINLKLTGGVQECFVSL
jgi:hypothetical protein